MAVRERIEPTKVLLVCANPSGTDRIRIDREERVLRESIQLSSYRDRIEITSLHAATVDDLHRALLNSRFNVVHFSGHGTNHGLVFEDEAGRIFVPSSEALSRLLGQHEISVAVFNACFSLSVGRLTAMSVDFTIASPKPIGDLAAIEFTRGFYDALGAGHSALKAYEAGKLRVELKKLSTDLILLKRGETFESSNRAAPSDELSKADNREALPEPQDLLLGAVIDTSGSMAESIGNNSDEVRSRLEGVDEAFRSVWRDLRGKLREEIKTASQTSSVRVFTYLFGTRINEYVDLLSLLRAAKSFDIEREIDELRRLYEEKGRAAASQYSGFAQLARGFGYGHVVDQIRSAAEANARSQIIAELGRRINAKAKAVGDVTANLDELYEMWGDEETAIDVEQLKDLLFGKTPMCAVIQEVISRFQRTKAIYPNCVRVLVVISDGEPTDGDPSKLFDVLKSSEVQVVTCFVSADDVTEPHVLHAEARERWSNGASLMFRGASVVDSRNPILRELLSRGWHVEPNAKAFLQVNHSEMLREFLDVVATSFATPPTDLLPAGR